LNVKHTNIENTLINKNIDSKKHPMEKLLNEKNVDKGTKGRREKMLNLFTRELE
jgi:hypothetical protein